MQDAWLDGQRVQGVPVTSRGLAYGDGLFETMAVRGGKVRLLALHLQRLQEGCNRLKLPYEGERLQAEMTSAIPCAGEGVLKVLIMRGGTGRGYAPEPTAAQHLLRWLPGTGSMALVARTPVHVRLCEQRLAHQPALAGLKHLNRLDQVLARLEWHDPTIVEGLLLDQHGYLVEGVSSNLFLVQDGRLRTPELSRCGVAGVLRRAILERFATACGLIVEEAMLRLDDLYASSELMLTNSLYGVTAVAQVGCFRLTGTNVANRLQQALIAWETEQAANGADLSAREWPASARKNVGGSQHV